MYQLLCIWSLLWTKVIMNIEIQDNHFIILHAQLKRKCQEFDITIIIKIYFKYQMNQLVQIYYCDILILFSPHLFLSFDNHRIDIHTYICVCVYIFQFPQHQPPPAKGERKDSGISIYIRTGLALARILRCRS